MGSRKAVVKMSGTAPCGALNQPALSLMAKEQQYLRMNAELEAKTAAVVRQAEEVMRDQNYILSKPIPNNLDCDFEDASRRPRSAVAADLTTEDPSLETTILHLEEKLEGFCQEEVVEEALPTEDSIGSEAQIRVLKAKLRIMQEELDRLSHDYSKKDDENGKLCSRIKELEEERSRLQKTANLQQTHMEKHRALAEESGRRCDALQAQVAGLQKEVEGSKRAQKQAAGHHNTVEVRLNRALEEVERLKAQLNNMKQLSKDRTKEVHLSKENLLAENKVLKKQREELILAFKKQLKLIDILKRQKMHFEAAKMLSFTEEEFMKALDWGKS
ncbi:testis-expressed protein 9 [Gadus macrocephalus]|uniref:testis-expressed protein 9 n=1 Tax=Gadus macrocephalus TaxID=80720 RepID=UPI0028CB4D6B|nr:testis-expressed protein 9 [Gadus macrocephalus]